MRVLWGWDCNRMFKLNYLFIFLEIKFGFTYFNLSFIFLKKIYGKKKLLGYMLFLVVYELNGVLLGFER